MASSHYKPCERLNSLIAADEVLTPSLLKLEALAVKECQATATWNSVIGMIQQLLTLLAGGVVHATGRRSERCRAWISGSNQDRIEFINIVQTIAADFYIGYSLAEVPIDEATRTTQTSNFMFLAHIKSIGFYARHNFAKANTESSFTGTLNWHTFYHDLDIFFWTVEVCAFKTMEKIVSFIPWEEMQKSVQSEKEKRSLVLSAGCFYAYKLQDTGEVRKFLITADSDFALEWLDMWRKVDNTCNMDYIFFKATYVNCFCGKSIEPGSECVILDSCYDLLCYKCAKVMLAPTHGPRRCPLCSAVTNNWMTSTVFEELKTRMKKRKEDSPEWRTAICETDRRKIPETVRIVEKSLVRASLLHALQRI